MVSNCFTSLSSIFLYVNYSNYHNLKHCNYLYLFSQYDFAKRVAISTGWGTTSFGGPVSDILQKVDLNIISNDQCKAVYGNNTIKPTQICTQGKGKDACQVKLLEKLNTKSAYSKLFFFSLILVVHSGINQRIIIYLISVLLVLVMDVVLVNQLLIHGQRNS